MKVLKEVLFVMIGVILVVSLFMAAVLQQSYKMNPLTESEVTCDVSAD